MSGFGDMMSMAAASSASEAAEQARKAASASEERLEGGTNPFITLKIREFDTIPGPGFLGWFGKGAKVKLQDSFCPVSIKRTDIAFLSQNSDDFGNVYTKINLEGRCNLSAEYVYVEGDMETVQNYINGKEK